LLIVVPIAYAVYRAVAISDYRFHPFLQAVAPNGGATVQVRERCGLADCEVDVLLADAAHSQKLLNRSDCWPNFAHVAWTADSHTVAGYLNDGLCGESWFRFDVINRQFLTFDREAENLLEHSVRQQYGEHIGDGSPLNWMRTAVAAATFRQTVYTRQ